MVISSKKEIQPRNSTDITMYGAKIETPNAEIHLSISKSCDGTNKKATTLCMQVTKWTGYSHIGSGLSGINGIVSKHIWDIYTELH